MDKNKSLVNFNDPKGIAEFLKQPANKIAEFITGILISESKDWKLSAGHLIQASIKWRLFTQLGLEIEKYIEKGKTDEDYLDDSASLKSLSDLLKYIDENSPDDDNYFAMKQLFLKSIFNDSSDQKKILSYQLMKLCSMLDSDCILILKSAYDISHHRISRKLVDKNIRNDESIAREWLTNISIQLGHEITSLIEVHEEKLMNLKLISPRSNSDKSGILKTGHYRLTDLGYKLCNFIYED